MVKKKGVGGGVWEATQCPKLLKQTVSFWKTCKSAFSFDTFANYFSGNKKINKRIILAPSGGILLWFGFIH